MNFSVFLHIVKLLAISFLSCFIFIYILGSMHFFYNNISTDIKTSENEMNTKLNKFIHVNFGIPKNDGMPNIFKKSSPISNESNISFSDRKKNTVFRKVKLGNRRSMIKRKCDMIKMIEETLKEEGFLLGEYIFYSPSLRSFRDESIYLPHKFRDLLERRPLLKKYKNMFQTLFCSRHISDRKSIEYIIENIKEGGENKTDYDYEEIYVSDYCSNSYYFFKDILILMKKYKIDVCNSVPKSFNETLNDEIDIRNVRDLEAHKINSIKEKYDNILEKYETFLSSYDNDEFVMEEHMITFRDYINFFATSGYSGKNYNADIKKYKNRVYGDEDSFHMYDYAGSMTIKLVNLKKKSVILSRIIFSINHSLCSIFGKIPIFDTENGLISMKIHLSSDPIQNCFGHYVSVDSVSYGNFFSSDSTFYDRNLLPVNRSDFFSDLFDEFESYYYTVNFSILLFACIVLSILLYKLIELLIEIVIYTLNIILKIACCCFRNRSLPSTHENKEKTKVEKNLKKD